jgi:hypothetical protein
MDSLEQKKMQPAINPILSILQFRPNVSFACASKTLKPEPFLEMLVFSIGIVSVLC